MKKQTIASSFRRRLFIVVLIAFVLTTAFLWVTQTKLAEKNAINVLTINIRDVYSDIKVASDENLLGLSQMIATDLNKEDTITSETLSKLLMEYDVSEINYIDKAGIIRATTYPEFMGYDMASGKQSSEFLTLLNENTEYTQPYGPVSFDSSLYRKYGGVRLANGGFVQVGYDAKRFQRDIHNVVLGSTKNRHVGENGGMILVNKDQKIVSDRMGYEGKALADAGFILDRSKYPPGEVFVSNVYGEESYCVYKEAEGYLLLAVLPVKEASMARNTSVGITTAMQIIIYALLFGLINFMVKKQVVKSIHGINNSLSEITSGKLDTVVNIRTHKEFDELSDDINTTVDTLKKYIDEAAARIDEELALAKAIQHSALPSVFPPYPQRKEFNIYAGMYTAKEVGGDFYDFYFVDEDNLAFLIADVSGKGIPAAMFMMTSKTILKSLAESGMSVEEVFTNANKELCEGNETGMFVTAWMGILNTKTGKVMFANAGHNPPLVKHDDGTFEYLKSRAGFVLAGMEGVRYRINELELKPGDAIYLYTDGVTEATNLENELYGEERLHAVLETHKDKFPDELCELVKKDVDDFVGDAPQFDDITMLTLKYNGTGVDL